MKSSAIAFSAVYFFGSLIIGPALLFFALGRNRAGTDCSDASWLAVSQSVKDSYFNEAGLILIVGSIVMIAIGGVVSYRLIKGKRTASKVMLLFLNGSAILGYALLLVSAGSWSC